jgi:membrane associated rhomboid family serine protease
MLIPTGIVGGNKFRPWTLYGIVGLNIAFFLWEIIYYQIFGEAAFNEVLTQIAFNVCGIGSQSALVLVRNSFFSMFLHGGILHILGNMLFLILFGRKIEEYFGRRGFLVFYLLAGFAATAVHAFFGGTVCTPSDPYGLVIGASGAVAGVMGAFLLLYPTLPIKTTFSILPFMGMPLRVPAMFYLIYFFAMDFVQGLGWYVDEGSRVAHWGHIGGFLFGFIFVFFATMLWRPAPKQDPFAYLDD